ncbi:hypothetical protein ACHHYP_13392 [Achlya hypogyna]|uniref:Uncharacterized protein n=1 Tax=Achlya hypogyna TaxID=1202772 RepID=A0A1V9YF95_ACHHY|nr:hypothetical protein ACHHYP_13392 [Achlya hypogyna]
MGQGSSRERKDAKAIAKKSVQAQKLERAKATGILSLHGCKLKRIPDNVFGITKLTTLDLSGNEITEVPAVIAQLVHLKTLKLDSNQIEILPDLSPLVKLQTLVLDSNRLVSLPALPSTLMKISARNNRLSAFPSTIGALPSVEAVDLSNNDIASVPDSIAGCVALKEITLDDNQLTQLPPVLARCEKLTAIFARKNKLGPHSIAPVLLESSAVHIMQLEGNPMTKFDLEAMEGANAFIDRRKQLKDKELHGGLNTDVTLCGLDA